MSKSKKINSKKFNYINKISSTSNVDNELNEYLKFNFHFFTYSEKFSQSFEEWESEKILSDLNNKLKDFSGSTLRQLKEDGRLVVYGEFPENTDFVEPKCFQDINVLWARLRITGRRRLIGVFIPSTNNDQVNTFYVVFLDRDHKFYKISR